MDSRSTQANPRIKILKYDADTAESRRKREEQLVEIRKNKREEGFAKKRPVLSGADGAPESRVEPANLAPMVCLYM